MRIETAVQFMRTKQPVMKYCRLIWRTLQYVLFCLLLFGLTGQPRGWPEEKNPLRPLQWVQDVPLPGGARRFDYQSLNGGIDYVSHMGTSQLLAFDVRGSRLLHTANHMSSCTGVLAVPALHLVFSSNPGRHCLSVLQQRDLHLLKRLYGPDFPDGIAWDAQDKLLFVSDESGRADWVYRPGSHSMLHRIALQGEAGNTVYDTQNNKILVTVQTKNELAVLSPKTLQVVQNIQLPGSDSPHGMYLDTAAHRLFIACQNNNRLLCLNSKHFTVLQNLPTGENPDVLAFDPGLGLLYAASESGAVWVYRLQQGKLTVEGHYLAPHAHTVAADPRTHRVYLPLQNINGRPVMRILMPAPWLLHNKR